MDDYTARVYTKGTLPYFPEGLSRAVFQEGQLMPKKYIETVGVEEFRKKPIGSGPWKFVRMVPGDRIEYEAIDYPHWRGTPQFKHLTILLVPEESTRVAMVRTGEAAIGSISPESLKEMKAAKLRTVTVPGTMQAVYQFYGSYRPEAKDAPIADVRVREALSLAINRQQIIDHVMDGQALWPMPFATFRYSVDMDVPRWESWSKEALRYDPRACQKTVSRGRVPQWLQHDLLEHGAARHPLHDPDRRGGGGILAEDRRQDRSQDHRMGHIPPHGTGRPEKSHRHGRSIYRTAGRPVAVAPLQ